MDYGINNTPVPNNLKVWNGFNIVNFPSNVILPFAANNKYYIKNAFPPKNGNNIVIVFAINYAKKYPFLKIYPSIPRSDYLGLLENCGVLVGNSSSGIIEGGYFKIPIINIGSRQKDREGGSNVIDVDNSTSKIFNAIKKEIAQKMNVRNIPEVSNIPKLPISED